MLVIFSYYPIENGTGKKLFLSDEIGFSILYNF
jgi:hypothetical protein